MKPLRPLNVISAMCCLAIAWYKYYVIVAEIYKIGTLLYTAGKIDYISRYLR